MKLAWKIFSVVTLCLMVGTYMSRLEASPTTQTESPTTFTVQSSEPVAPVLSRPVSSLAPISPNEKIFNREINTILNPHRFSPDLGLTGTDTKSQDPLAALSKIFTGRTPAPLFQFEGLGTDGFAPPDTVGEVGPNHYIQMVNISFRIFDKTGNPLTADLAFTTLFAGSGLTACENENNGDPIVVYDELADRWLLSQFAISSGERMCIAISQTGDPTGSYHLYQFDMPAFPDYFKFGVWTDAYYMTTNTGFPNQYFAYAFDRARMLAGQTATFQFSQNHPNFMMPADIDGSTPPPAGTPGYFYTMLAEGYPDHPAGVDRLRLYEFDVDWTTPGNSTFTIAEEFPIADYNYTVCGFFVGNCIPQTGTAQGLDSLSYWPMWRLPYRNLGSYQAMVGNFTVDLDGTNKAAIRWFELRNNGSGWELHQEGTHAPDADHRWMGSIAMDGSGNIAMGYSVSSPTTSPSIRYASRLASDPNGTLQTEVNVITSGGSQTGTHRWGDYSSLNVDPVDDCTFWFTTEYHDTTDTGFTWNTRIVAFRLPECTGGLFPDFALQSTPANIAVCTPDDAVYNIDVLSLMDFTDPVDLSLVGNPAGTSVNFSVDPVTPPGSSVLTVGNTGSAAAGSYDMSLVGVAPTSTHTITLGLDLYDAEPVAPNLTAPADGATGVGLSPAFTWDAVAGATGYYLEVAEDAGFATIVYTATVSSNSHNLAISLDPETTYHWRVTASNICGDTTSTVFDFTTALLACSTPNLPLPDDPDVSDVMTVNTSGDITDLDLIILANHTWVGDTIFTLTHNDTGTSAILIDRPGFTGTGFGCSGDNINVVLNDEGADGSVESQCAANPALFGSPTPNNPLSVFDGEDLAGTWTLNFSDGANGDTGTLTQWCLVPTANLLPNDVDVSAVAPAQNADAGTTVTYTVDIENTGDVSDTYDISVMSSEGWSVMADQTTVSLNSGETTAVEITVMVPLTATGGTEDATTVTAVSDAAPSISDSVVLTTTVNSPEIVVNPTEMEVTIGLTSTATQTLTIMNSGGGALEWEIVEVAGLVNPSQPTAGVPYRLELIAPQPNPNYVPNLVDIIQDGGFEGGTPSTFWGEASTNFGTPLCTVANCGTGTGTGPRTGTFWAWFGGASGTEEGSLTQDVVIPTGTATLTFYLEMFVCDATSEFLEVTVDGDQLFLVDGTSPLCGQLGYVQQTVDLSAYADGNSHTIEFHSITSGGNTNFFVDDVVLDSTEGSGGCIASDIPWLSLSDTTGTTLVGDSTEIDVVFDSTGYAGGVYTGTLCISSNDPAMPEYTVPVTMTVIENATYGVEVMADTMEMTGTVGTTITYTVWVTNTGNVNDTFAVELSGHTWTTWASHSSINLAPGEMGTVMVMVTVPPTATHGITDTTMVMITSNGDDTVSEMMHLTTTAVVPAPAMMYIYLPVINREP